MTTIRISQYTFELSDPFSAGHSLAENEASALNALRAENIRNAISRIITRETGNGGEGRLLSSEALSRVQAEAERYDAEYVFGSKRAYTRSTRLETLAREIARPIALAEIRRLAESLDSRDQMYDVSAEKVEALIAEISRREPVLVEARLRLEEEMHVTSEALESLL